MRTNKLLTTLAIVFIASVALFTGCNKDYHEGNGYGRDNDNDNSGGQQNQTTTSLVNLGTASTFAVLGGTTVTNVPLNASIIDGDAGVGTAGNALTGFNLLLNRIEGGGSVTDGAGIVTGTIYAGGPIAAAAHADAQDAYDYLMLQLPVTRTFLDVQQLAGLTLTPGIYYFPSSADLAVDGTLTLDFQGNSDALFIFQIVSALVTGVGSDIVATNTGKIGPKDCLGLNVFWAVGSSATINGDSFIGTVIAYKDITMNNSTTTTTNVAGRLLALTGEVTIINSIISTCGTSVGGKPGHNPKPCRDFVTGGGWINDKETFGVSGGIKNGKFWGQLSYNNHDGIKVKSTEVTGYTFIDATTREIKGLARINGEGSFEYTVTVSDNGEPGRDDTFTLIVDTDDPDFTTSGILEGGNIQLHKACGESHNKDHKWDRRGKHDGGDNGYKEDYDDKDEKDGNNNCNKDGRDNENGRNRDK